MSNFTLVWHFLIFGVLPYVVGASCTAATLRPFQLHTENALSLPLGSQFHLFSLCF